MFRLRAWKLLCRAGALSLYALLAGLGGCATTAGLTPIEPVEISAADAPPVHRVRMSDTDAELVIARAIAEHEMRRP
jgi:hypothetical protein